MKNLENKSKTSSCWYETNALWHLLISLVCVKKGRVHYLLLIVGQSVLVDRDDVHEGVAPVLADLLQLRVSFIDVSIQLQEQETGSGQKGSSDAIR